MKIHALGVPLTLTPVEYVKSTFCVLRSRQIGKPITVEALADQMAKLYKPHRDKQNVSSQLDSIGYDLKEIREDADKSDAQTKTEIEWQIRRMLLLGLLCEYPPESEIVKELFERYLGGMSTDELATLLIERKVPTKTGKEKWRANKIAFILSNEKYIGDSLYQKTYRTATVPFKQKKNYGSEDQIYAEGTHEGFINRDTFDKVQTLLKKRKIQHSRITEQTIYPFTHRIQCSECGAFYRRRIIGGSIAWGCVTHINDRTKCASHYYREDRIMDAFIGIINRLRFAEEGIIAESIELTEKAILLKKRNNLQALESSQSMAELNAKLLMLEQLKSKGYLAQDVFESQSREINGQINEIKTKRIQSLSSALDLALEEFKTLQARLNEIDEPLDSFDPKLFEEVIKGMTVNNRDDMTFRLIGDLTFTVRL